MMQRFFLKSLVGLFFVVATSQVASGHTLSFIRSLVEEAQAKQQAAAVDSNIDQANSLGNPQDEGVVKGAGNKHLTRKFVNVQIEGSNHTIRQGESYELVCNVDASPAPRIAWVRGEHPTQKMDKLFETSVPSVSSGADQDSIARVQSKYVIDCASQQDQGPIYCVAMAGDKTSIQSATVKVLDNSNGAQACKTSSAPVITQHTTTIFSLMGSSVVLPCRASGTPRPQTRWVDGEGVEITNHRYNPRYQILATGDLLITDLEWADMGGPTCIAQSSAGEVRAETFLYPLKRED